MRHRKTGNFGNISQISQNSQSSQNSSSLALVGCSLHLRLLRFRQGTPRPLRFFTIFLALRLAFTIFVV